MKKKNAKPSRDFMVAAGKQALRGVRKGEGGPFGAVITRGGKIVARGNNQVLLKKDPTAHAEVVAIRAAARALKRFDLSGCELYTSCEPCPMCLAAAYWAGIDRIFFSNTRRDAAAIGFGDAFIYAELEKPATASGRRGRKLPMKRLEVPEAAEAFEVWERMDDKAHYGPKVGVAGSGRPKISGLKT